MHQNPEDPRYRYHGTKLTWRQRQGFYDVPSDMSAFLGEYADYLASEYAPQTCPQMDFNMYYLRESDPRKEGFREGLKTLLESRGWTFACKDLGRFKGLGTVDVHADISASNDRDDYPDSDNVYNACLFLKLHERQPDLDGSPYDPMISYHADFVHFLTEIPGEDANCPEDAAYKLTKCREGDIMLFDQTLHHGIMTDQGYWLLIFVVRKLA